jgi:hypothetical protein
VCGLRSGAAVRKDAELVPLWVGKYDAQMRVDSLGVRRCNDERFLNRPKRERPKVPTICTRPLSVAQVLGDTRNPARTLGVL